MGKGKFYREKFEDKHKLRKKLCHFCLPRGQVVRLYVTPTMKYIDIRSSVYGRPAKTGLMLTLPEYLEMVQKLKNDVDKLIDMEFDDINKDESLLTTAEVPEGPKSVNE